MDRRPLSGNKLSGSAGSGAGYTVDHGVRNHGSVTYSTAPLDDSDGAGADDRSLATRSPGSAPSSVEMPGKVPSVTINGQLYSSVPGRSFILVNGHRYHEGERMASGPAVESIDPSGATLIYRGQRYHVPGPG